MVQLCGLGPEFVLLVFFPRKALSKPFGEGSARSVMANLQDNAVVALDIVQDGSPDVELMRWALDALISTGVVKEGPDLMSFRRGRSLSGSALGGRLYSETCCGWGAQTVSWSRSHLLPFSLSRSRAESGSAVLSYSGRG